MPKVAETNHFVDAGIRRLDGGIDGKPASVISDNQRDVTKQQSACQHELQQAVQGSVDLTAANQTRA